VDILHLIDRLETLVSQGTRVPGLGKIIVDPDQLLDIIDQMRISVPKEMHEARRVLDERDLILSQAKTEAESLLAAAREEIEHRLQSSDIVRQAQERAQQIIAEAQRSAQLIEADANADATATRREADEYSIDVIRRMLAQIDSVQAQLRGYIEQVQQGAGRG
jgi:cell division septum initiation protein DivIVA